ncbi:MAG TPA: YHS domain-containing (seleno)protein [Verrucomicrobiae bacterium]|nr:YHS domain-containing (seleno)protein [Verrucomicrobiae bacterium]
MKKTIVNLILLCGLVAATRAADMAGKQLVLKNKEGLALQGYDLVAYFTDGKPVKGVAKISSGHEGAKYLFASAAHKALFDADPAKYSPAYGGYCGYAASIDRLSPVSPEWFQIEDGKLILQHNKKAFDLFNKELRANVAKADENWPGLVARNGVLGGKTLVFTDKKGVALGGYDPVSYFTEGKPALGDRKIEATFDGALYHFVSQEHRATFEKAPTKYAPAYGGFCGYAASVGKVRPANPLIWSIVDGQLIVQHTKGADDLWRQDVAGNKVKADKYWPLLVEAKAGKKDPVDSLLGRSVLNLSALK